MNVFHKVTIQSLKKNKSRTIATIIGIMFSTALLCAITTSFVSFVAFTRDYVVYEQGNWQGFAVTDDYGDIEKVRDSSEVKESFAIRCKGLMRKSGGSGDPSILVGAEKGFYENMPVSIVNGRLPENENEIIVFNDIDLYKIGDKIEFDYVDINSIPEDFESYDELFKLISKKEYTIVGKFSDDFGYFGESDFYTLDGCTEPDGGYGIFFNMKEPRDIFEFMRKNDIEGDTNSDLLVTYGAFSSGSTYLFMLGMAAIVIGLVMLGSFSLINNAFSISVNERTKQFGLLSSIGATKKQIQRMVEFEAFIVGSIGIILGIILGIAGIGATFALLKDKIMSIINVDSGIDGLELKLKISFPAIVAAVLISAFLVRFSGWIPSVRATRVSAVEAIRQTKDIRAKKIHTPKFVYKIFGFPGMLADKYFKRSKKMYRATETGLVLSVVLFVSAVSFTSYLVDSVNMGFENKSFDISFDADLESMEEADELLEKISAIDEAEKAAYVSEYSIEASSSEEYVNEGILHYWDGEYQLDYTMVEFIDDDTYRDYIRELGLDEEKFMDPENPLAIAYDTYQKYDSATDRYEKTKIFKGDEAVIKATEHIMPVGYEPIDYDDEKKKIRFYDEENDEYVYYSSEELEKHYEIKVGKTTEKYPYFLDDDGDFILLYPECVHDSVSSFSSNTEYFGFQIVSDEHKACTDKLKELFKSDEKYGGFENTMCDYAAELEAPRNLILIIKVFAYGFVVLISLISVVNVFNTITTNVAIRKREFAMLRSVGMSSRELRRMTNFECIIYGTKSLLLGLPLAVGITYLIFKTVNEAYDIGFYVPVYAVIAAVFSVFAVVFTTMIYSMNKIKKDNPIDALKNENT